ncbi:MAG: hypothetical protein ABJC62_14245 [Frankiaceae bacterium]
MLAENALLKVIDAIGENQWQQTMPTEFATRATDHPLTLGEVVNYHAYDDAWVPDMLAGRTMAEVGADAFQGDLLGDDPKGNFAAIVAKACAAATSLDDLERTVHCSFGDFPAREYLWQINSFRGLRAHDLAKVIGADPTLPGRVGRRIVGRAGTARRRVAVDRCVRAQGGGTGGRPAAGPAPRAHWPQARLKGRTGSRAERLTAWPGEAR